MANDFSGRVWIIDTPNAGFATQNHTRLAYIRWVAKTAIAGDEVVITDENDKEIWRAVASGANYSESDYPDVSLSKGFKVPTLASGKLYLIVS